MKRGRSGRGRNGQVGKREREEGEMEERGKRRNGQLREERDGGIERERERGGILLHLLNMRVNLHVNTELTAGHTPWQVGGGTLGTNEGGKEGGGGSRLLASPK